ncbi:hypothetical protein O181_005756 [Austropuccinia psidii MF-1]|uniref:Mitochondrial presequence protease n=1 Tax=Austropuccinia psidii MF-1 TaxID=1389203 RepID=A0A9Q3BJH1_9BASI|nr:hypothetical protein [Austropuccinia psidii MF-1]
MPASTKSIEHRSSHALSRIINLLGSVTSRSSLVVLLALSAARPASSGSPSRSSTDKHVCVSQAHINTTSYGGTRQNFVNASEIPSSYGNFDRVIEPFLLDSAPIRVAKWRSRKTGLSVVWIETQRPLINADITVATEIFNDSGIPHTLEHLTFHGSEKYPYGGSLDILANRAFAYGTNAGTSITSTSYTIETAGPDGLLRILPVYFDHIFNPTLLPEAFITEVYHINDKGEEAGVVFSEMQGLENSSSELMFLCTQRALYPPTSAYRSETSGLMDALRVLTVDQIKDYHNTYYRPYNLQLLVTGKLDLTVLLKTLQEQVEPSILEHGQNHIPKSWKRPFLETSSKGGAVLDKNQTLTVEFPSQDESLGEILLSWIGPKANEFLPQVALTILGTYLSEHKVSPLSKNFIETASPLCTSISFAQSDGEQLLLHLSLSSVPAEHLLTIGDSLRKTFAEEAELINMDRMGLLIQREMLKVEQAIELDPHGAFQSCVTTTFLYGSDNDLFLALSTTVQCYKTIATWSAQTWSAFFKKWLVESPTLTVIGRPSARLSKKLGSDNTLRTETNQKKYGPEGLKKVGEELKHAQQVNARPLPDEVISQFPIPSLDSIKWIDVEIAQAHGAYESSLQSLLDRKDPVSLPYFIQFNHIDSNFLSIHIVLSPSDLPAELFSLLPIYIQSFFSLPIKRKDGTFLSCEQVVRQLDKQTVDYAITPGSPIAQTLDIHVKVEQSNYAPAIAWLRDLLWGSAFDPESLRTTIIDDLQNIRRMKADSNQVLQALYHAMIYPPDVSPLSSMNFLLLEVTQPIVLQKLKSEPQPLLKQMEQLRSHLLKVTSMRISVSGNIRDLQEPKTAWLKNFEVLQGTPLQKPLMANTVLGSEGAKPSGKAVVSSIASSESNHALHFSHGPQGFDHPDNAALAVALSALNAIEGYLWKAVRGPGLAYMASLTSDVEIGHVVLGINSSPDSFKAFHESAKVVKALVERKLKFDNATLEAAKSTLVYFTVSKIANGEAAASEAFANLGFKSLPPDFSRNQLQRIMTVSVEDAIQAISKYILPIFNPKQSSAIVACSVTKAHETAQSLSKMGYSVEQRDMNDKM